jgi:hypothetical protein
MRFSFLFGGLLVGSLFTATILTFWLFRQDFSGRTCAVVGQQSLAVDPAHALDPITYVRNGSPGATVRLETC